MPDIESRNEEERSLQLFVYLQVGNDKTDCFTEIPGDYKSSKFSIKNSQEYSLIKYFHFLLSKVFTIFIKTGVLKITLTFL